MFNPAFYDADDRLQGLSPAMAQRLDVRRLVFDEFYRCYPIVMLPGPEREAANYGGKVFMPPSALDKLTRLHITYPMLFELINGAKERVTHAGVLEFIAEEGKIYLPFWIMQTLLLEPGDLLQIKSTDLPSGAFIKLQPQSTSFLDISDPKAVLENVMRNFSCLTTGDIFSFAYNDEIFEVAVLETKPQTKSKAISVHETDLEVDFAAPLGYVEPSRARDSGTSTPRGQTGVGAAGLSSGTLHVQGSMAQAINYSSIAPSATAAAAGAQAMSSHFLTPGQKLSTTRKSARSSPLSGSNPSGGTAPVSGLNTTTTTTAPNPSSTNVNNNGVVKPQRTPTNGPQPLRLPPGKLFFGYELKPVRREDEAGENIDGGSGGSSTTTTNNGKKTNPSTPIFAGAGQTLRGGNKRTETRDDDEVGEDEGKKRPERDGAGGRTLRDGK